jgi:autotransporter-associated beta strand protein
MKCTLLLAAAAASVIGLNRSAQCATATWSAAPAGSNWNAPNWTTAGAPYTALPGDALIFGTSSVTGLNNDFAAGTTFSGITFNTAASAFTLNGNSVNFTGGVLVNSAGSIAQTINFGFTAAGSLTMGTDQSGGNKLVLNQDTSVATLSVLSSSTTANTLTLTKTLNVGAIGTIGIASTGAASLSTTLSVTGAGTLSIGSPATNFSFNIGVGNNNNGVQGRNLALLDMSTLANFSFVTGTGTFGVGNLVTRPSATVQLANTLNTITSNGIVVGDSNQSSAGDNNGNGCNLLLGAGSNVINANVINIGFTKTAGTLSFLGSTGSVLINGETGGTTNIVVGRGTAGTDTGNASQFLLAGHQATVQAATVQVGVLAGSTAGNPAGNLSFDTGVFNVGSLQLANYTSGSATAGPVGTFTLGGASPNTTATGVLNVNTQFALINRTASSAVQATGVFNINGGTANINTDITIVDSGGAGARNATINLAGGTLNMMGHAIGNSTFAITNMNFPTGTQTARLMNLGGGGIFAANGNGTAIGTPGGVVMNGTGTLIIDGPSNTYTGGTTINSGRLIAASALPSGGTVTVSGGTLAGTSNVGNLVTTTGTLAPGTSPADGSVGTLSMNSLTVNSGTFRFDLSQTPGASDRITVNGPAVFNSASTIVPVFPGPAQSGNYTLLTATSLSGTPPMSNAPSNNTRLVFGIHFGDQIANAITLDVSGALANLTWVGNVDAGGGTFVWDVKNTQNWTSSAASDPNRFYDLDIATFDDSAANRTVTINSVVSPTSVFVNNSVTHDYTFTGTGAIGASADFAKSGTGAATLLTSNTYSGTTTVNNGTLIIAANQLTTGATVVNGGTLVIGNGSTAGALGSGSVAVNSGGNLVFNRTDDTTVGNVITGSGTVIKAGSGSLALTATSTYTGTTNINAGTVLVNIATAAGSSLGATVNGGAVNIPVGSTMELANINSGTNTIAFGLKPFNVAGNGGGSGVIVNNGTTQFNAFQVINLTGDATFGGSRRFDMRFLPTTTLGGTLTLNNNTLHINGLEFGLVGIDVGTGTISVESGGTLSLETASRFLADPNSAIVFQPNSHVQFFENTGTTSQTRQIIINGSGIDMGQTFSANTAITSFPILLKGDLQIHSFLNSTGTLTLLGNITEDGTPRRITKSDTGRLVLGGSNSFTGGLDISNGLVQLNSVAALAPAGTVNINGTGSILRLNGNSVTIAGLNGGDQGLVENASATSATLSVNNTNDFTYSGVIQDGTGGGTLSLTKSGTGRLSLNGSNTYTGPTTISGGTVELAGNGALNPASNVIGAGSGGTLLFNRGDNVAFSNSITGTINLDKQSGGQLTLPSTYSYTGSATLESGTVVVNGALTPTGTTNVTGATLSGTGNAGRVRLDGGNIRPGVNGSDGVVGTLNMSSLTVNSGELRFDLGATSDLINVSGQAIFNGGNISVAGIPQPGTYTVLTAGALTLSTPPSVTQPSDSNNRPASYTLNTATANTLKLVITGGPISITWTGNNSTAWDIHTTQNWTSGSPDFFYNQDFVNFTQTSANRNVTINNGDVSPGTVVFSHSTGSYTINGGNGIAGSGGVTISGGGTVVMNTNNSYTGTTAVQNGTFVVGNSNALPNNGNVVLGNGVTSGVVDLAGFNVNLSGLATSGTGAGNIIGNSSTSNQSQITYNGSTATVFGGVIQDTLGSGNQIVSLTVNAGTLVLAGNNTFSGQAQVNGTGALQIGNGGNSGSFGAGNLNNDGTVIFNRSDTLVINKDIGGGGRTVISSGTVQVGDGGTVGRLSGGTIVINAALVYNRSDNFNVDSPLSGTGVLHQSGTGTLTLTSSGNFSGGVTVNSGAVRVATAGAAGSGATITLNNGTFVAAATIGNDPIVFNGGTLGSAGSPAVFTSGDLYVTAGTTSKILAGDPQNNTDSNGTFTGSVHGSGTLLGMAIGTGTTTDGGPGIRFSGPASDFNGVFVLGTNVKGEVTTTVAGPYSPLGTGSIIMTAGTTTGALGGTYSELNLRNNRASGDTVFGNNLSIAGTGVVVLNPLGSSTSPHTSTLGTLRIGDQQTLAVNKNNTGVNNAAFQSVVLLGGNAGFQPVTNNGGWTGTVGLIVGAISETLPSSITMNGLGTFTMTGSNSYTGGTNVQSGTLISNTNLSNGPL